MQTTVALSMKPGVNSIEQFQVMLAEQQTSELFNQLSKLVTVERVQEMKLAKVEAGSAGYWAGWIT